MPKAEVEPTELAIVAGVSSAQMIGLIVVAKFIELDAEGGTTSIQESATDLGRGLDQVAFWIQYVHRKLFIFVSRVASTKGWPRLDQAAARPKDLVEVIMRGVRGANRQLGEVRRSQNWIGGSRPGNAVYVPPPPDDQPLTEVVAALRRVEGSAWGALPDPVRALLEERHGNGDAH